MNNKHQITVSAPGKLMLFGGHAVVYGHPCIVTSINQRLYLTALVIDEPSLILDAPDTGVSNYKKPLSKLGIGKIPKGARFIEFALLNFYKKYHVKSGIKIETNSDFSPKFGFGSSSAATVCTIFALSKLLSKKITKKELFDLSYKTILDIQGKGSGFDVAAAIYGGTLYFKNGGEIIKPLKITSLPLIVGYSGVKAETPTILDFVAKKAKKEPKLVKDIYDQIEKIVDDAKTTLEKKEWQKVGDLMNSNQEYLSSLGVSSKKLDSLIFAAINSGAYGAKLSGAGVGDCIIAISPPSKGAAVKEAIKKVGGTPTEVVTNTKGAKLENMNKKIKTTDNQDELFVVVDKNDKFLGYKTRGECHSNANIIHRGVGIVIFNDKNEVLLQKRSMTKDTYPGWFTDSTGGHVARGESYRQTAKREVFEEIGIKPKLKFMGTCMYHGINETEIDGIFTAIHNGPFKLNKKEVTSVKFVSQKSLKQMRSKLTPYAIVSFEKIGLL